MLETPLIQNQYPESDLLLSPPTAIPGAEPTSPLVCLNATASSPGCFLYCILKRNRSESIPQEHGRPLPERCSASPLPSGSRTLHHSAPCEIPLPSRPLARSFPAPLAYLPFFQLSRLDILSLLQQFPLPERPLLRFHSADVLDSLKAFLKFCHWAYGGLPGTDPSPIASALAPL